MKKVTAVAWAVAVGAGVLFACSSSNNNSGGNTFAFSGPSCPQGSQPMQGGNQACSQCQQSHCSGQAQCINSDCSGYFTCFCACMMGDLACYGKCTMSSACNTCFGNINSCGQQNCSSECARGGSSGSGSSGSAGSGSSSSGGTTPTGSCAQLAACCTMAGLGASCSSLTGMNNQSFCQQALMGFQDAGLCH